MNLWRRVLEEVGLIRKPEAHVFALEGRLALSLQTLAEREQRPAAEVASSLLKQALEARQAAEAERICWNNLTPREQQITALICLGYTGRQIAFRLDLSPNTVKTHVANILRKFALSDREGLRRTLQMWDFSEWGEKV